MKNLFFFSFLIFTHTNLLIAAEGDYRTRASGNWNATNVWEKYTGGSWVPVSTYPTYLDGDIEIRSSHSISVTSNVSVDQVDVEGTLTINSGVTLTVLDGTGTDLYVLGTMNVNGTIACSGTVSRSSGGVINFNSGSLYQHNVNGGSIPNSSWNVNSTCEIKGVTDNVPSNLDQVFGNFIWNCTGQTAALNAAGNLTSVNGNFTMTSTGSGSLRIATTISTTLTIGGNYNQSGGVFITTGGAANVTIVLNGNFSMAGGQLREDGTGTSLVRFNKAGVQTFNKTGGTMINAINFEVISGSHLDLGTSVLGDYLYTSGNFTLNSGGTIATAHSEGIGNSGATGCIQVSGMRTYSAAANYVFNRNGSQSSGNGLPTSLSGNITIGSTSNATALSLTNGNLTVNTTLTLISTSSTNSSIVSGSVAYGANGTLKYQGLSHQITAEREFPSANGPFNLHIDNVNNVTLHSDRTINGTVNLTNGCIILGSNNLILGPTASITGAFSSSKMIITNGTGELRKRYSSNGSFTFPVGENSDVVEYSPVILDFTSGTYALGAYAGVRVIDARHPQNTSLANYISRYWACSQSGINNFTCNASFYYTNADVVGSEAEIYCGKWNGSIWQLLNLANASMNELSGTVNSLSDFTGGEESALPIQLVSFTAKFLPNEKVVQLDWTTLTEVNNYGFDVERKVINQSPNQNQWKIIGFVIGSGNSNSPKEYSFIDRDVSKGKYIYRLKQIDADGKITYSHEVEVEVKNIPDEFVLYQNYPNPFNPSTKISFSIPHVGTGLALSVLKVYDVLGNEVATLVDEYKEAGKYEVEFNPAPSIQHPVSSIQHPASSIGVNSIKYPASGVYFYQLRVGDFVQTKKMVYLK